MLAKKKDMSFFQTFELIKVNARIAEISEDLEKLKSEKERQILLIGVGSDEGVKRSKARIGAEQDKLWKAEEAEAQYSDDLNMAAEEFHKLEAQAANFDPDELMNDRLALRMQEEQCAVSMLKENYAREYDDEISTQAKADVAKLLCEECVESELCSLHENLKQKQQTTQQREVPQRKELRDRER